MRLPSENVLDVLQCVDFATLLALQRSASAFYGIVYRNQSLLPRLRIFHFRLDYDVGVQVLRETVGAARKTVQKSPALSLNADDAIDYSLLHAFQETIGTNFVDSASIAWSTGPGMRAQLHMQKAVEALPALQHVRSLSLECKGEMHPNWTNLVKPFDNLEKLILFDVNDQAEWLFLRDEWALRLRFLSLAHLHLDETEYPEIDSPGQVEILAYCTDFVHLPKGKSKTVRLHGWRISPEFMERLIKTVAECNEWITVEVGGVPEFTPNDDDYARVVLRSEDEEDRRSDLIDEVRYSCRDGSHRIVVLRTLLGDSILVTNNPFVTSFHDVWTRDMW